MPNQQHHILESELRQAKRDREIGLWQVISILILLFTGLALLILGVMYSSVIIQTVSAAIIGAAIAHLFGIFIFQKSVRELRELARDLRSTPLGVQDIPTSFFQNRWHLYAPRLINKQRIWIHILLDLGKTMRADTLSGMMSVVAPSGDSKHHRLEIERRDDRLLFFIKPVNEDESIAIYIFPLFFKGLCGDSCGFAFVETYDREQAIIPGILLRDTFANYQRLGEMPDKIGTNLDLRWHEDISSMIEIPY